MANAPGRRRLYIPAPCNIEEVLRGLGWLARELGQPSKRGLVVVSTFRQIRDTLLGEALGADVARAYRDRTLFLPVGGHPRLVPITAASKLETHQATTVLLLWPSEKTIEAVDRWAPGADMLAVAWIEDDGRAWEQRLGFSVLGGSPVPTAQVFPVVRAALQSLTARVNMGTGLGHPLDEAAFVEMLYLLREGGEVIEPDFIVRTLVELRWNIDHARDAGERAGRFASGARLRRPRESHWADGILERWREAASTS